MNTEKLDTPIPFPLYLNIQTEKHLMYRLGYPTSALKYFITHKSNNIQKFSILRVKNGKHKERIVYNTSEDYKKLLRIINKNLLQNANLPSGVLGGVIGKNINDMVSCHCGKEAVFSIDLKDFFPSIKSGKVFNFFVRTGCNVNIAEILTDLVTYEGALPQGFPTSTSLANLIAYDLDIQHLSTCQKYNITRTRWIDDIVFSGRTSVLKQNIKSFIGAIKHHGYKINNKKTEFTPRKRIPIICGLEVNKGIPHIPLVVINKISDILLECKINGPNVVQLNNEYVNCGKKINLKNSLEGKIRYISQYNKKEGQILLELFNEIPWDV